MMEPVVIIYCLQRDKILIDDLVKPCKEEFERLSEEQLGKRILITLKICENNFLLQRDLNDFTSLELNSLNEEHENINLLPPSDDDKYWFSKKFWRGYFER